MEVGVALDTIRLTDLLRGDPALQNALERLEQVWLPLIVLGEIQAGFLGGKHGAHNQARPQTLLATPRWHCSAARLLTRDRHFARIPQLLTG